MPEQGFLTPAQIAEANVNAGIKKAHTSALNLLILGFLAGVFIAFASEGSNMAAFNLLADPKTYGLGKALAGSIFGTGLMLVILAGGELFTGNTLMLAALMDKKITVKELLRNWFYVYVGNFVGSVFIAYLISESGQFASGANMLGGVSIKIAVTKVSLTFIQAFFLGILCNWLVCLAVWMAYGAKDMSGKIWAIFFPIWLFITSGFEHSIANMYYIPAGIFASHNPDLVSAANTIGVTAEKLFHLNWGSMLVSNLLPVTLGNIVGGGFFVGMAYWFVYLRNKSTSQS